MNKYNWAETGQSYFWMIASVRLSSGIWNSNSFHSAYSKREKIAYRQNAVKPNSTYMYNNLFKLFSLYRFTL